MQNPLHIHRPSLSSNVVLRQHCLSRFRRNIVGNNRQDGFAISVFFWMLQERTIWSRGGASASVSEVPKKRAAAHGPFEVAMLSATYNSGGSCCSGRSRKKGTTGYLAVRECWTD